MTIRNINIVFGSIFVAVGLLGFIANPLVSYHGIFAVNAIHNLVHILTGAVLLAGAIKFPGHQARVLQVVGLAYAVVAILGFLTSGNMLLGIIRINEPDRWLHLGLAVVILSAWYMFAKNKRKSVVS